MLLCTGVWLLPCWRSMSNNSTASPLSSFLTAPQYLYLNQSVSDSVTGSECCSKQSTAQMLPAAGSLGYHYQAELPDGTILCSRQPETLPSVGTHTCSDQDTSSPGHLCAPVTLAEAPPLVTAQTGRRGAGEGKDERKNGCWGH